MHAPWTTGRLYLGAVMALFAVGVKSEVVRAQRPTPAEASSGTDVSHLFKTAKQSFVEILADGHMAGSGAFVGKDGYVITAAHVLGRPGRRLVVLSPSLGRVKAELVAVDIGHDLALLKAVPRDGGYPALPVAKVTPKVGTTCYLMGTPLYRHALLLTGKVARQRPGFEFMGNSKNYAEVYYIAGPSPPGTSGGVWLNASGEVVGVQSMLMSVSNSPHGISFVVPPAAIVELLKTKQSASTPSLQLAVEEIWQHIGGFRKKFADDAKGLFVRTSRKNGPAHAAGLKEWELIQSVDGKPVERAEAFLKHVRTKRPGDSVKLVVLSPDAKTPRTVSIPLAELEKSWNAKPAKAPSTNQGKSPLPTTKTTGLNKISSRS
ncbi:MAG: S1C family serine protease [Pirellulales bacterium]|nr:S1C family serine protease [Pirellulales bacterium]